MAADWNPFSWRKSSHCANSACIEIAYDTDVVLLRNSTDPEGIRLAFSRDEWATFLDGVRTGDFDLPGD